MYDWAIEPKLLEPAHKADAGIQFGRPNCMLASALCTGLSPGHDVDVLRLFEGLARKADASRSQEAAEMSPVTLSLACTSGAFEPKLLEGSEEVVLPTAAKTARGLQSASLRPSMRAALLVPALRNTGFDFKSWFCCLLELQGSGSLPATVSFILSVLLARWPCTTGRTRHNRKATPRTGSLHGIFGVGLGCKAQLEQTAPVGFHCHGPGRAMRAVARIKKDVGTPLAPNLLFVLVAGFPSALL